MVRWAAPLLLLGVCVALQVHTVRCSLSQEHELEGQGGGVFGGVVVKRLVHTTWWPPANDKFEEAVGVESRGFLFMTGMMEPQTPVPTFNATRDLGLELDDIRDIVAAGNSSLEDLVDCVINVPVGAATEAQAAFVHALGGVTKAPGVTVLETQGEDPSFNSSTTCFSAVVDRGSGSATAISRRHTGDVTTITVGDTVWVTLTSDDAGRAVNLDAALRAATSGAATSRDLVDCTAFVPRDSGAAAATVRAAVAKMSSGGGAATPAAITVVETGLGGSAKLKLRCTALVGAAKSKVATHGGGVRTVVAGGFAYVDGVAGASPNGTDAFSAIKASLAAAGSRMNLVLNCLFFVTSEAGVDPLFGGFDVAFNKEAPPPPSRTEFVGASPSFQCLGGAGRPAGRPCPVLAKCVAAMPA